jgi:transcriptional regulator with XRE-family HTH domain
MTAAELRKLLEAHGMSQRGTAKLLGINERTMRDYVAGETKIPGPVAIAVRCLAEHGEKPPKR